MKSNFFYLLIAHFFISILTIFTFQITDYVTFLCFLLLEINIFLFQCKEEEEATEAVTTALTDLDTTDLAIMEWAIIMAVASSIITIVSEGGELEEEYRNRHIWICRQPMLCLLL